MPDSEKKMDPGSEAGMTVVETSRHTDFVTPDLIRGPCLKHAR